MRPIALVLLAALAASGCDTQTCTLEAVPSVSLRVVDADTGGVLDAKVTFLHDGDGPRDPEEAWPGTYTLALELEGTFDVTVEVDGYQTETRTYEVTADECHVETVTDEIELTPLP